MTKFDWMPENGPAGLKSVDERERALLDQLIAATGLYNTSKAVRELFEFTARLRAFAPFNAMLLHIQKPGLRHAATARDWRERFDRTPKKDARPLLILRTMGPVDFVFDVLDTEGPELPSSAFAFPTLGNLTKDRFWKLVESINRDKILIDVFDAGDNRAGYIELMRESNSPRGKNLYRLAFNGNHSPPTQFVTVAHELAHLHLGHLGPDRGRRIPDRKKTDHKLQEVEAEMTAYLVAKRNEIEPSSESYLANFQGAFEHLNLYAVMRAANAVETAMGISARKLWNEKAQE